MTNWCQLLPLSNFEADLKLERQKLIRDLIDAEKHKYSEE